MAASRHVGACGSAASQRAQSDADSTCPGLDVDQRARTGDELEDPRDNTADADGDRADRTEEQRRRCHLAGDGDKGQLGSTSLGIDHRADRAEVLHRRELRVERRQPVGGDAMRRVVAQVGFGLGQQVAKRARLSGRHGGDELVEVGLDRAVVVGRPLRSCGTQCRRPGRVRIQPRSPRC